MTSTLATPIPLERIARAEIEHLLDRAFGPGRHERTAYRIREGMDWLPELSFAVVAGDGGLIATIQTWPVALTDPAGRAHKLLMVGPVAVSPEKQDMGYGRALLGALTRLLSTRDPARAAQPPQMLIGDPEYYGRFGFSAEHTGKWQVPGPVERHRLLARADDPAALPSEGMLGPWPG